MSLEVIKERDRRPRSDVLFEERLLRKRLRTENKRLRAENWVTDASVALGDLTVVRLQQFLSKLDLPKATWQNLHKLELVKLVEKQLTDSGFQDRIGSALKQRASVSLSSSSLVQTPSLFSRINTNLVLLVATFLTTSETGKFASCDAGLRLRLTLRLRDTPTPGLAALRCVEWRGGNGLLTALLSRAVRLQSLSMKTDCKHVRVLASLPITLRSLTLTTTDSKCACQVVGAFRHLVHLERLCIKFVHSSTRHVTTKMCGARMHFPHLTTIHFFSMSFYRDVGEELLCFRDCTALREVQLNHCFVRYGTRRFPNVHWT